MSAKRVQVALLVCSLMFIWGGPAIFTNANETVPKRRARHTEDAQHVVHAHRHQTNGTAAEMIVDPQTLKKEFHVHGSFDGHILVGLVFLMMGIHTTLSSTIIESERVHRIRRDVEGCGSALAKDAKGPSAMTLFLPLNWLNPREFKISRYTIEHGEAIAYVILGSLLLAVEIFNVLTTGPHAGNRDGMSVYSFFLSRKGIFFADRNAFIAQFDTDGIQVGHLKEFTYGQPRCKF